MIQTENETIRLFQMGKLRELIDSLPRKLDPGIAHVSELILCPMKPHLTRTLSELPPHSEESILQFTRGRLFERMLSAELPPKEKEGIVGTVDGQWNGDLIEIKSTASGMDSFKPYPWWLSQSMAYCHLYDTDHIHLIVWFLVGNKWNKNKGREGSVKTSLNAWTLTFTPDELAENWDYLKEQRELMFHHIDHNELPPEWWVEERRLGFECRGCRHSTGCPYHDKGGM